MYSSRGSDKKSILKRKQKTSIAYSTLDKQSMFEEEKDFDELEGDDIFIPEINVNNKKTGI